MSVRCEIEDSVARVIIDRPEVLNAIDEKADHELNHIWSQLENQPAVRAIINTKVAELAEWLETQDRTPHQQLALEDIRRWQNRPEGLIGPTEAPTTPQGSPIGTSGR